ncbi:poly-gamma-glutamate hydrolase family protein [Sorangium sp. So ce134]
MRDLARTLLLASGVKPSTTRFFQASLVSGFLTACVAHHSAPAVDIAGSELIATGLTFRVAAGVADEACRLDSSRLNDTYPPDQDRFLAGTQLRIERTDADGMVWLTGLCTVQDGGAIGFNTVEVSQAKFSGGVLLPGTDTGSPSSVSGVTIRDRGTGMLRYQLAEPVGSVRDTIFNSAGRVVEHTRIPTGAHVAFTAPHPSDKGTVPIVEWIANNSGMHAIWAVGINGAPGSGANAAYHINSNDISRLSFRGLNTLASSRIPDAVSFHSNENRCGTIHILVGGGASPTARQGLAEMVSWRLQRDNTAYEVKTGTCHGYQGDGPENFINEITTPAGRGIQLEIQQNLLRDTAATPHSNEHEGRVINPFGMSVATATLDHFNCMWGGAHRYAGSVIAPVTAIASGLPVYSPSPIYSPGPCSGYILDAWLSAVPEGLVVTVRDYDSTQDRKRGHLDLYEWRPATDVNPARWDRVGGGFFTTQGHKTKFDGASTRFPFIFANGASGAELAGRVAIGTGARRVRAVVRLWDGAGVARFPFVAIGPEGLALGELGVRKGLRAPRRAGRPSTKIMPEVETP